jgi:hypothetical protein
MNEDLRKKKLAHLFAVARQAGYDDRTLREIVEIQTGSESLRVLNVNQLKSVITTIQKAHPTIFKSNRKKSPKPSTRTSQPRYPGVHTLPSLAQRTKLQALEIQIQAYNPDFLTSQISLRTFKKLPSALTLHQFQALIEAHKSILHRISPESEK